MTRFKSKLSSAEIMNIVSVVEKIVDEYRSRFAAADFDEDMEDDVKYLIDQLSLPSNKQLLAMPIPTRRCVGMKIYKWQESKLVNDNNNNELGLVYNHTRKDKNGDVWVNILSPQTAQCFFFFMNPSESMKVIDDIYKGKGYDNSTEHCYCGLFPHDDLNASEYELYDPATNSVCREEEEDIGNAIPALGLYISSDEPGMLVDLETGSSPRKKLNIQFNRCSKCIVHADFINDLIKAVVRNKFNNIGS